VSEKKADKSRYWVTYLIKDFEVGETFKPTARHLTILTWFVTELETDEVIKSFKEQFSGEEKFKITIGEHTEFKNSRKIEINLVLDSGELQNLHKKALGWFNLLNARWAVKSPYVGEQYIPHIRRRAGHNLSEGETLEISSLTLVCANRRGDDVRNVIAKVNFK
jgi:2'-5' RNA ligase